MEEKELAVGDLVRLKSGGPAMTVTGLFDEPVGPGDTVSKAHVAYFDESKLVSVEGIVTAALRKA